MSSDDDDEVQKLSWMVRPCDIYYEEYKDCRGPRGRLHQYFVHGSLLDCTQWKRDEENCLKWTEQKNIQALKEIIDSEKTRKEERLKGHDANDVWQRRTSPPEDWNAPLPDWYKQKGSGMFDMDPKEIPSVPYCSIM